MRGGTHRGSLSKLRSGNWPKSPSERHARPRPVIRARRRACNRPSRVAPSLAGVAARASSPRIQHGLAPRVEREETEHAPSLVGGDGAIAADQLVVAHPAVGERDGAPCECTEARAQCTTRSEHEGIEEVALQADEAIGRTVVVRTRQRRDEVYATGRSALHEAAARHLDGDVDRDGDDGSAERCGARVQPESPLLNIDLFCSEASRFSARSRVSTTDAW